MPDPSELGQFIAAVEIAQSIRHEARNHLNVAQENLALIAQLLHGNRTKASVQAREAIDRASTNLVDVGASLDRMKAVFRPPEHTLSCCSLAELCHDAAVSLQGRFVTLNVNFKVIGDSTVQIYKDLLRHAILQLLLNSLEAFQGRFGKMQRQISIQIKSAPTDKQSANDVVIRYTDNAGGIDFRKLRGQTGDTESNIDIFSPGVTSKSSSSGYGLYLARRIISRHGGSIELLDTKGGVVFEIRIASSTRMAKPR